MGRQFKFPAISICRWDSELARVAQVWADQCASVIYRHGGVGGKVGNGGDLYPLLFHERGIERATKKFQSAPGVGQVRLGEPLYLNVLTQLC